MEEVEIINGEYLKLNYKTKTFIIEKKFGNYKAVLQLERIKTQDLTENELKFIGNKYYIYNVVYGFYEDKNNLELDTTITYQNSISHLIWVKNSLIEIINYLFTDYCKHHKEDVFIICGAADNRRFNVYKKALLPYGFKLRNKSLSYKQNFLYYDYIAFQNMGRKEII